MFLYIINIFKKLYEAHKSAITEIMKHIDDIYPK